MSLFSFFKKNKESYSLVFNISSGSVSGGVIRFTEAPGENVSFYAKEIIPFQKEISVPKHLELMKTSLNTLADKIRKNCQKKIDRVFYIFSSPWCASQTKTIRVKESKTFKVTSDYLNHLIDEQEKTFQTDITKAGKAIERKIIQVKLNGYIVDDFYNKSTKELEVSVFFTVVPENVLQTVEQAVSKVFLVNDVWCHSLALTCQSIIKNFYPQKNDFIYIDISEEITDISIIMNNIMVNNVTLPLGRNDFIRELSKVLNVSKEIADSQISIHNAKANDDLGSMKLAVAMDKAGLDWLSKISQILNDLREKVYVPDSIFLIVSNDLIPFLKEKIEKQDFKVVLLDNKKIKPPIPGNDIIFKLGLMFLDNLYKI
jgi:cell division ATPase FtsA